MGLYPVFYLLQHHVNIPPLIVAQLIHGLLHQVLQALGNNSFTNLSKSIRNFERSLDLLKYVIYREPD